VAIPEPAISERHSRDRGPRHRTGRGPLLVMFGILAVIVVVAIVLGIRPRLAREKALLAANDAATDKRPVVNVAPVHQAAPQSEVELPADLQALIESPVFARADGYLSKRLVDIGDRVRTGQVLAEIETPELDQQLSQARANVAQSQASLVQLQALIVQARANLKLAKVTYDRWKRLAAAGVFSKQESDEREAASDARQADLEAAQANLNATEKTVEANAANVRRLENLKSFAHITAPFDGIITARNIDVGTLINAGNGGATHEIFRIAQIQLMRIFVNVPQTYASEVHAGQSAELRVQELPGRVFKAAVERTTNSVDPSTRTMLAVLRTPNPTGVLLPGMYTQVRFSFPRKASALLVPGDALVMGREGPRVAVVGPDHAVHMRSIRIVRDYGSELEVESGVLSGDMVVVNPSDQVREGAQVETRTGR